MRSIKIITATVAGLAFALAPLASTGAAPSVCTFTTKGTTMKLQADCTTDHTITIPQGFTLDGANHTVTAVDPSSGHFIGPVVTNAGTVANVDSLKINAGNLAIVCDSGTSRLRGILFDSASGKITNNTILALNQGQSGCQEGNAIEVRYFSEPGDGNITSGPRMNVTINNNKVYNYQKTGIVANGYVNATISDNTVGASEVSNTLTAANSIQMGYNATGSIVDNNIVGNQWCGNQDDASTAILLYAANSATVKGNTIIGNSDIAMYMDYTGNVQVKSNEVKDLGTDCNQFGYDTGIGNYPESGAATSTYTNNDVRGFTTPYDGVTGKHNTVSKIH